MTQVTKIQMIKEIYIPLVTSFLEGKLEPEAFVRQYFAVAHQDQTISNSEKEYRILQDIFEDADAYSVEPDLSLGAAEIDEVELRRCCQINLLKLVQILENGD